MKKNVILADCAAEEVADLAEELDFGGQGTIVESYIANGKRTGIVSELRRYGTYFAVGFQCFCRRREYNVIVGWQQFYALIFCFFCNVFRVKKENTVIVLNFTYREKRGIFAGVYRWFAGKCLSEAYCDYLHVLSESYADRVSREFSFPRDRILVTPFGVHDAFEEYGGVRPPEGMEKEGYALAIGRSNRDYDFLIRAWKGILYPLVILSDTYTGKVEGENVTHRTDVAGADAYPWIANCALLILPIEDEAVCAGDTVLLTAMSLQRRILVTAPSALAEMYIAHGENAVLAPKEITAFQKIVGEILYSGRYADLGARARESYLKNFSLRSMGKNLSAALKEKMLCPEN